MTCILAIESSCDETAAAVVEGAAGAGVVRMRSNVVATQIELHRRFGGVFPEVASRQHVLAIQPVVAEALAAAGLSDLRSIDAIAVTQGPGLAGSLLVGVNAAKGIAFAAGKPLLPINHLEGHIYSNWIETPTSNAGRPAGRFPVIVLIVSGGHTELILMHDHCRYQYLGSTLDDAAGEAFDKVARLLDMGFPGGPAIQKQAQGGDPARFDLPRGLLHDKAHRFDFSFSGLKTAVLNLTRRLEREQIDLKEPQLRADLAASFQAAVAGVLIEKTAAAALAYRAAQVCICGGVSANAALRDGAIAHFGRLGIPVYIPPLSLCTDNAAMIGAAAFFRWQQDPALAGGLGIDVFPTLPLPEITA